MKSVTLTGINPLSIGDNILYSTDIGTNSPFIFEGKIQNIVDNKYLKIDNSWFNYNNISILKVLE